MVHSLYIHIPFCVRKCIYCDFLSVRYDDNIAADYVTALINELAIRKEAAGEIKTVYIGGGTPTTLSANELVGLINAVRSSFAIPPDAEITIEANPGTIDKEKIDILRDVGINRLSLGIQSFIDRELQLLGRIHSASDGLRAIEAARECGIKNLSIDLIYAIPGQTYDDWKYNASKALAHSPEHISAYELTPEPGTPLFDLIQKGSMKKPDEDAIVGMYFRAIDSMKHAGYKHYEISNFAKPGFECRHNMNYWDRGEYIGLGAGAHSFIKDRRIKSTRSIEQYINSLNMNLLAVEEDIEISCEDALKEFIFLGLRKTEGIDIKEFKEDLGIDIIKASGELINAGMLISDEECLKLTRHGLVVSNSVITQLFKELDL